MNPVYPLNQYTLAAKFGGIITKLAAMDKKDRGLGREFKRLLDQVARPAIHYGYCLDFTFELAHTNLGGLPLPDWVVRLIAVQPLLKDADLFQYCALALARSTIVDMIDDGLTASQTQWVRELLVLRFQQVDDTMPWSKGCKFLPVVSVRLPIDLNLRPVGDKLVFLQLLKRLAERFAGDVVIQGFIDEFHHHDQRSVKTELHSWKMFHDVLTRRVALTTVFQPNLAAITSGDYDESWFGPSPLSSVNEFVYLAK